mmetsp:Transcript_136570/g.237072  ORF Transcript_136570/g.237072 Transcript_136570/m.237072 type:complete len:122 (+) Transcript_136570:1546-1911(+)
MERLYGETQRVDNLQGLWRKMCRHLWLVEHPTEQMERVFAADGGLLAAGLLDCRSDFHFCTAVQQSLLCMAWGMMPYAERAKAEKCVLYYHPGLVLSTAHCPLSVSWLSILDLLSPEVLHC